MLRKKKGRKGNRNRRNQMENLNKNNESKFNSNDQHQASSSGSFSNKHNNNNLVSSTSSSAFSNSPNSSQTLKIEDDGGGGNNDDEEDHDSVSDPIIVSPFSDPDETAFVKVLPTTNTTTNAVKSDTNIKQSKTSTNKHMKNMKNHKTNSNSILSRRRSSLSVDLEVGFATTATTNTIQQSQGSLFYPHSSTSTSTSQQFVYDDDFYPDSEDEGVFLTASNNSSSTHNNVHDNSHSISTNNTKDNNDIDTDTDFILSSPSPYLIQTAKTEEYEQIQPSSNLRRGTPIPPRLNNHGPNPHQNVHSSMSLLSMTTNNAITVAPSRNQILEPNVFDTGGIPRHKRHKDNGQKHRSNHHGGRRSKTPEPQQSTPHPQYGYTHNFYYNPTTNNTNHRRKHNDKTPGEEDNLQSVLNRLDYRITKKFGDWSNMDDDRNFEYRSIGLVNNKYGGHPHQPQRKKMTNPFFGGEAELLRHSSLDMDDLGGEGMGMGPYNSNSRHSNNSHESSSNVTLPPLIKTYHAVLRSSKGKLHDKSKKIAMSRDNNDPNSILSRAKQTLNGL